MSSALGRSAAYPPSVERVLAIARPDVDPATSPDALAGVVRELIGEERDRLRSGGTPHAEAELAAAAIRRLHDLADVAMVLPPVVVNATGVILHTNLGRAPWAEAARRAAIAGAAGYGYLELDPATGRRGPRFPAVEDAIVAVTGAGAGFVATNNAAALLLGVGLAGRGGSVVVSRGELVEIGGGVRIPEMIARAGARLIEVGTTNRTRAADFEPALAAGKARVVLRVHPSNFSMHGFAESADLAEVAEIAHRHGAIVVDDLGSGALLDTADFGLVHEPMPSERLAAGADVVLFSGDKLVGGPQAGIIAGRRDVIERMRRDPLARAVRPDKAILAAVATTLGLYRAGRAVIDIPVWQMIARSPEELRQRAESIVGLAEARAEPAPPAAEPASPAAEPAAPAVEPAPPPAVRVVELESVVGGGALPGQTLRSFGVGVRVPSTARAAAALRNADRPILARVADDELLFDLRTAMPREDELIAAAIRRLLATPA